MPAELRVSGGAGAATVVFANDAPLALIAGPNTLESAALCDEVASELQRVCTALGIAWVFKGSFDKANRSSYDSPRGPGLARGLDMLAQVQRRYGCPVITDIHTVAQAVPVAEVCDMLQIPAFLSRQTDLIAAACATGKPLHIKKAQFLAPDDMAAVVAKCRAYGNERVVLCERGTAFGYHNLVVDMLGFGIMKALAVPVTFDVTHALQLPGGLDGRAAGGRAAASLPLALAGVAQGIAGLFVEMHPEPSRAAADGPSALPLSQLETFLRRVQRVDAAVKEG